MIHQPAQKQLYIIFSETSTRMGGMIRTMTHNRYNHVSLALDEELTEMYSFARHYKDTPLYGGFVREGTERYLSERGTANIKVCALPLNSRQYADVRSYIGGIAEGDIKYLYNMVSAACFLFHRQINIRYAYTCIEFIINVLKIARAPEVSKIPSFCSLRQLEAIYSEYIIYEGKFPHAESPASFDDDYTCKNPLRYRFGKTISSNSRLLWRLCHDTAHKKTK